MGENYTDHDFCGEFKLFLFKILDVILVTLPFGFAWMRYYADRTWAPFYNRGNWLVIGLFSCLFIILGRVYEGFQVNVKRMSELLYSQSLAILFSDAAMYVVTMLLMKHLPPVLPMALVILVQGCLAFLWIVMVHGWYYRRFPPRKTVVVYDIREDIEDLIFRYQMDCNFQIERVVSVEECLSGGMGMLGGCEAVFLWGIHFHERNLILKWCLSRKITVYVLPRIGDVLMSSARKMHIFNLPVLRVGTFTPDPLYACIKRTFDIILSVLALVILSPVMLFTAAAIWIEDGGPVFYRQTRVTKDGKHFCIIKFRSMRVDAEKDSGARISSGTDDARVTRVGRVIRMVRIDEIPQFINIIRGEMSVVGPRPERPELMAEIEKELPEFALRLQVKAGLTGYAQVYGKYNATPYDKLQMDLMYITKASVLEDLEILLATVKILIMPESTGDVERTSDAGHTMSDHREVPGGK